MIAPHAFVFLKHPDQAALGRTILEINKSRHQPLVYDSLILTAPSLGWIALLLGEGVADHLLLRNLSGRLNTLAFELAVTPFACAYRLHRSGRTESAFESNLLYYINNRLHRLQTGHNLSILDLVELADRYILRRYQEQQRGGPPDPDEALLFEEVQTHYAGNAAGLRPVLRTDADEAYVNSLLAPGFSPEATFSGLAAVLDLPYLPGDEVPVTGGGPPRFVTGYAITDPATWQSALPEGWRRMAAVLPG